MQEEKNLFSNMRAIPRKEIWRRVFSYNKKEIWSFVVAVILVIFNVAMTIMVPLVIGAITNNLQSPEISISYTLWAILILAFMIIISVLSNYGSSIILAKAGQRIIYDLRLEVFNHIEHMTQAQLNEMPVGSLVTRVASYTQSLSDLFTNIIVDVFTNSLTVVGVFCIMMYISPTLSGVLLIIVFVVFVVTIIFRHFVTKCFRNERNYVSDINTFMNENLSGMKITQIFNQEHKKEEQFIEKNENLRKAKYSVTIAFALYRPFISFLYFGAIAITFYFGIELHLEPGAIVSFYLLLSKFFNPVQNLADSFNQIQKSLTACEKLFNLLDLNPDVLDAPDAIEIEHFKGKVEFKNVWFSYLPDEWVLKDVSFIIQPGDTCAFVGATGAGKTTILSLIVRNYIPQKGQILIDDIDISKIKISSLRKAIGQMLQDVFLFSGSIRTNITLYDDAKYSDAEINDVCKYVNADSFIDKLPNKLEEEVIERGENFSSGQRQLLSFARTVLAKPQIMILDEATANIDTETEVLIQNSLDKIKNIGTMLVVAHRLSTIQHADNIIVLQDGKIIEQGNHQTLLKNKGYYYKLYELQFEGN